MPVTFPDDCRDLLMSQRGIITRRQAVSYGIAETNIDSQLRSARWQPLYLGVYATFTGPVAREAQLTAAVLRAGRDATLSHHTAAELTGLADEPSALIHITVPATSHPEPIPGIVIHRSTLLTTARHPVLLPPRTRVEETTLDLVTVAAGFDEAYGWLCRATGRRLTTAARLTASAAARTRMRWRTEILDALKDIAEGVQSNLERRYVCDVERAHQLPTPGIPITGHSHLPAARTSPATRTSSATAAGSPVTGPQ